MDKGSISNNLVNGFLLSILHTDLWYQVFNQSGEPGHA